MCQDDGVDVSVFVDAVIEIEKMVKSQEATQAALSRLENAERTLSAATAQVDDAQAQVKNAKFDVVEAKAALQSERQSLATAQEDVRVAAQLRVDAAQGDVRAAQGDVRAAQGRVDEAKGDVRAAQGRVDEAQSRFDAAQSRFNLDDDTATLDARLRGINELVEQARSDQFKCNDARVSLIRKFRLSEPLTYASKVAIVEVAALQRQPRNEYELCAVKLHERVLNLLRANDVAVKVRSMLHAAAHSLNVQENDRATSEGLCNIAKALSSASAGERDFKELTFVVAALVELEHRCNDVLRDLWRCNEATVRLHNGQLLTSAFAGAQCEISHSTKHEDAAAVERDTTSATAHHSVGRRHDEIVLALDDKATVVLRGETAMRAHKQQKRQTDQNRMLYAVLKQWIVPDAVTHTSYSFVLFALEFELEMSVVVPLYWRVLLQVPIFKVDLSDPSKLTYGVLFDYLRDVVAISQVVKSKAWVALGETPTNTGTPGTNGSGGAGGGGDDDDGGFGGPPPARIRKMANGQSAQTAEAPAPVIAPSAPAQQQQNHSALVCRLFNGHKLAQHERSDSTSVVSVFVVDGGAKVLKLLAANDAAMAREAARELFVHTLLTRNAPAAIVPLVAATSGEWIADDFVARHLGLRACDAVTVLEMACADERSPDWAGVDGVLLSARGEQLLAALAALAAAGVVHGDVKPLNIVVHEGTVRVIDFGASAVLDLSGRSERVPARGTRWFMAPEVAASEDGWTTLTPAVDVFGAGRVLSLAESAMRSCAPLRALVERMTAGDAGDRPTMAEALREWRLSVAAALRPPPPQKQAPLSAANPNRLPRAPTVTLLKQARARQSVGVENENDAARLVTHRTQH
jgi:predicted negative regulator of RcsB-dependent stress response